MWCKIIKNLKTERDELTEKNSVLTEDLNNETQRAKDQIASNDSSLEDLRQTIETLTTTNNSLITEQASIQTSHNAEIEKILEGLQLGRVVIKHGD